MFRHGSKKIILLDRDGVINHKSTISRYVTQRKDFHLIHDNIAGLQKLAEHGFRFIVITNQACVHHGILSEKALSDLHAYMVSLLQKMGIHILGVYHCPHRPNERCACRKPEVGLFKQVAQEYRLRLNDTVYIGDDAKDCTAAFRVGMPSVFVGDQKLLASMSESEQPSLFGSSILMIANQLLDYFHRGSIHMEAN